VRLFAVDLADAALAATRANVARHNLGDRVAVRKGDLLAGIPADRPIDWVLSNPPYIPAADIEGLEPEVREHEPRLALDGGADGLDAYRRLIPAAAARARRGVLVEVGIGQSAAVEALMRAVGIAEVTRHADLGGVERVVCGRIG
jgi:release factor glutamine methyltransferase